MQATTQTRLPLAISDAQRLDQMAGLYGTMKRKLYARIAAAGGKANSHKTAFCREHGISARMFNAMAIELDGLIASTRRLLVEEIRDLKKGLRRQQTELGSRRRQLAEVSAGRLRMQPQRESKLRRMIHRNVTCIEWLSSKLAKVEKRLESNVPGICFGTRKRFRQQYNLEFAGFRSFDAWADEWRGSRSHQIFFVGSKGETSGNQLCQLSKTDASTYSLKIRVPDRLLNAGENKCLVINDLKFEYDRKALDGALEAGTALTWRLHRDDRGWRAFVSFNHQPARQSSHEAKYGAVGIEFNAEFLEATETDAFGNMLRTKRHRLLHKDASSGQRHAVLSDALTSVVAWAKEMRKPLATENADFAAKKKAISQLNPEAARMLSGLTYAKYRQLLEAKCFRAGVELILIDPAYTSTIGAVKYASRRGWSVHAVAAGVLARRAQKLTERLPRAGTVVRVPVRGGHHALELPARKSRDSRMAAWSVVHAAYRGVMREHWLATRSGSPPRSAKGIRGCDVTVAPLSRDNRSPCEGNLHLQTCAPSIERSRCEVYGSHH
jgi:IS605 OrfB family transposase